MDELEEMKTEIGNQQIRIANLEIENKKLREDVDLILFNCNVQAGTDGTAPADNCIDTATMGEEEKQKEPDAPIKYMRPERIYRIALDLHFCPAAGKDMDKVVNAVALRPTLLRRRFNDEPELAAKHGITAEDIELAILSAGKIYDDRAAALLATQTDPVTHEKVKEKGKGGIAL